MVRNCKFIYDIEFNHYKKPVFSLFNHFLILFLSEFSILRSFLFINTITFQISNSEFSESLDHFTHTLSDTQSFPFCFLD